MTKDEAITKVQERHLDQLLHPQFANEEEYADRVVGRGLPASPGAAVGQIVFTPEEAQMVRSQGGAAILVRGDTSPEDVGGMHASEGILTQRGGMTSHAAVVARGWPSMRASGLEALAALDKACRTDEAPPLFTQSRTCCCTSPGVPVKVVVSPVDGTVMVTWRPSGDTATRRASSTPA